MIKELIIKGLEMTQPSDFYEWILLSMINGKFSEEEEDGLLTNLQRLYWIKLMIFKSFKSNRKEMYFQFVESMRCGEFPQELMTWSAIYYNFTQAGINTEEMRTEINNNLFLRKHIEENYICDY